MPRVARWRDDLHMAWTVLIVDDHAGFRGFARRLLEADGFTVVGEAGDGTSALAAVDDQRPEIVLLDVVLPDIDGFAVAERLAETRRRTDRRAHLQPGGGRLRPGVSSAARRGASSTRTTCRVRRSPRSPAGAR